MKDYDYLLCKYLNACKCQKCLSPHTLRAYRIDLEQFKVLSGIVYAEDITPCTLEEYIESLNNAYSPRTVQRKISSLKAFCNYLEYNKIIRRGIMYNFDIFNTNNYFIIFNSSLSVSVSSIHSKVSPDSIFKAFT